MKKFPCNCGKNVRDVYYKNGEFTCVKCFSQGSEYPFDYIINILAERGFVITFQNEPVLVMKQFSADLLDEASELVKPNKNWFVIEGDNFWSHFNGSIDNLRSYITEYGRKKEDEEQPEEGQSAEAPAHDCSNCNACSNED